MSSGVFGSAKRIIVTKDTCTIIGGNGDKEAIAKRIAQIKTEIEQAKDNPYDTKKLSERLARLDGGVGVITVGANTEREAEERRDLVDDAFCACKAALAGGVVQGGGPVRGDPTVPRQLGCDHGSRAGPKGCVHLWKRDRQRQLCRHAAGRLRGWEVRGGFM